MPIVEKDGKKVISFAPRVQNREPLTYQDLVTGNQARALFEKIAKTQGEAEARKAVVGMPSYTNSRNVFGNLDTTDLIVAGVLAGQNICLIGPTGRGKSQLAEDFSNHFFGGKYADGGSSVVVKGSNDLESIDPVFVRINPVTKRPELTGAHNSAFYNIEEFNRCLDFVQNQLYDIFNHRFIAKDGSQLPLGVDNYASMIATANAPGTNDGRATFESPNSLWNRFAVILDQTNPLFDLTREDKDFYQFHRGQSGSGVVSTSRNDLLRKILGANKEISSKVILSNPEALSAFLMATRGLETFVCGKEKATLGDNWPTHIPCGNGCTEDYANLRTWVTSPFGRSPLDIQRYASALKYLSTLKDPNCNISDSEFIFRAFELNGAYQPGVLNPNVLNTKFAGDNHAMAREIADRLTAEYNSERGERLITSVERAMKGKKTKFFQFGDNICAGDIEDIPASLRERVTEIPSGLDSRGDVDYSSVLGAVDYTRELNGSGSE